MTTITEKAIKSALANKQPKVPHPHQLKIEPGEYQLHVNILSFIYISIIIAIH